MRGDGKEKGYWKGRAGIENKGREGKGKGRREKWEGKGEGRASY